MTADLLASASAALLERREDLIRDLVVRTRAEISALDDDASTRSLLEASISENIVAALNFIARGISPDDLEAPTAALVLARTLAQRDVPLSALIRAYRIGHSVFLDAAFAAMDGAPVDQVADTVITLVRLSAEYIDRIVEQVGRTYELERDRWVASTSGVRQQWVNDVLSGRSVDERMASTALGYPLDAQHVAVSFWIDADTPTAEASARFAAAVSAVRSRARAASSLLVPEGERDCLVWFAFHHEEAAAGGGHGASWPGDTDLPTGVTAARSWEGRGLDGFRRGAAQVRSARELHRSRYPRSSSAPRWVGYDDVAVASLLTTDLRALREMVGHTLGPLAEKSERNAMLRSTLAAFLRARRSYQATATHLNLHRNSVQYRIQQAQDLLPVATRSNPDDLALRCALEACAWWPDGPPPS